MNNFLQRFVSAFDHFNSSGGSNANHLRELYDEIKNDGVQESDVIKFSWSYFDFSEISEIKYNGSQFVHVIFDVGSSEKKSSELTKDKLLPIKFTKNDNWDDVKQYLKSKLGKKYVINKVSIYMSPGLVDVIKK